MCNIINLFRILFYLLTNVGFSKNLGSHLATPGLANRRFVSAVKRISRFNYAFRGRSLSARHPLMGSAKSEEQFRVIFVAREVGGLHQSKSLPCSWHSRRPRLLYLEEVLLPLQTRYPMFVLCGFYDPSSGAAGNRERDCRNVSGIRQ